MTWQPDLFANKVVVVTGGTSGIGAATALRFADLGARVHAMGLSADGPMAPRHDRVTRTELDVRDPRATALRFNELPELDVLICCAGISRDRAEYALDTFSDVIEVNLTATMRCAEAARPLLASRGGSISLTASMYS